MAIKVENQFQTYQFESGEEERQSKILTDGNLYSIRNKLALATITRAHLEFDTTLPLTSFVQQEAHLKGEIDTYQVILDEHYAAVNGNSKEMSVRE